MSAPVSMTQDTTSSSLPSSNNTVSVEEGYTPSQQPLRSSLPANIDEPAMLSARTLTQHLLDGRRDNESDRRRCFCNPDSPSTVETGKTFMPAGRSSTLMSNAAQQLNYHNSPTLGPPASRVPSSVPSPAATSPTSSRSCRRKLNNAPLPIMSPFITSPGLPAAKACAPSSASTSSVVPVSPLAPKETLRAYIALRLAGRAEIQERILQLWDAGCRAFDDDRSVSRKLRSSRSVPCLLTYRRKLKQFDNVAMRPARMLQYPSSRSRRLRGRGGSPKLVDSRGPVCAETRDASYVKDLTVTAPAATQLNSSLLLPPSGASTPNSATSQHLATETGRHISAFYLLQSDFVLRAVIQQITPTDQERHIKRVTVNALAALIKNWRGDLIRLSVAGSTAYDVDSTASDLDVVLMTYQADHRKVLEELSAMISNAQQQMSRSMHSSLSQGTDVSSGAAGLFHCGSSGYDWPLRAVKMQLVQNARVPILLLKCPQGVVCDISVNTNNSISHTKFFRAILKGKPHLRALMRLVKYWVKVRRMPAMRDGGLPSIVWMLLCVFASRHSEICYSCLGLPVTRNQENVFGKSGVSTEAESNDVLSDSTYLVERFASKFTRWMWSLQLSLSEANAVSPYTVLLAEFFSRLGSRHALTCTVSVAAGLCIPKNTHDVAQRVLSPPWHGGVWDELLSVEDPANMDGTFFPEALLAPPSAMLSRNLVGPNVCPNGIPTPMFHDLAARISSATWLVYQYELRRADMLMEALIHDFEAFRRQFSAQASDRVVSFLKLYLQRFSRLFVALFAENAEERYRVPAALTDANPTYTQNILPASPPAAPEVKPVAQMSAVAPRATENEESPIGSQNGYNFALVLLEGKLMLLHLVKVCADRDGWWSTEFLTRRDIRSVLHGRPFFAVSLTPRDEASSKKTPELPHEMLFPFETKAQKGNAKRWVLCSFNLYRRILEQETGGKGGVRSLESPFQSVTDPDCEILFNPCNLVCFIRAVPIISQGTEGSENALDQIFALPSDEVDEIEMYTMFAKEAPYWYTNAAKTLGAQKSGKAADVGSSDPIQPAVRLCKHCGKTGLVQFQPEFGFPHRPLVLSTSLDSEEQVPVGSGVTNASSLPETSATLTPGMQLLKKFIAGAPLPPPLTEKEQKRKDGDLETKIFRLRKLADEEFGHVFSRLSSPFKFNEARPNSSYSDAMQAEGVMPSPSLVQPANSPRLGVAKAAVRQEKVVIPPPPLSFNQNTSRSVPQPMRVSSASDHRGVRERQTAWKSQVTESYPDFRPVSHGRDAIQEPDSRPGQQQRQRYIVPPPPPPPPRPVSPKPLGYSDHSNGYRRRRLSSETTDALSRNTCLAQREIASEPLPPSAGLMSPQRGHRPISSNSVHNNPSESQSSNQLSLGKSDGLQNSISSSFHDHAHHRALRLSYDQLWAPVVGASTGAGSRPGVETPMHYSPLLTQHNLVPSAEGGRGKRRSEGNTAATTLGDQHPSPFQPVDSKSTDSLGSRPSCSAPTRSEGSRSHLLDSSKPGSSPYALPSPPMLLPYLNTWKMMPQDGILPPGQQHPWRQYVMAPIPPPNVSVAPHFFCNPSQRFPYPQIPSQIASFGGYPLLQYFPPPKHSSVVRSDSFHRTSTSQDDGTGVLAQRGGLPLSPSFSSTTSSKRLSATRNRAASASSLTQSDGLAQDGARDGCSAEKTSTSVACNHSELRIATDTPQVNSAPEFNYYACHPPRPPELKSSFGPVPPVVSPIHDPPVASSPCYITVMFAPQQPNGLVVAQGFPISLPETSELNPSLPYTVTGSPLLVPQPYPFFWGSVPPHPGKPAEDKLAPSQLDSFSEPSLVASASEALSDHETHDHQKSVTAAPTTRRSEDFCSQNAVSDVKSQEVDVLESFLGEGQEVLQTNLQPFATSEIVTETYTPACPEVRTLSTDAFETASSSGTTALVEPRTSPDVRIVPLSSTVWETSSLTLPNNSKESVNTVTKASGDGGTQHSTSVVDTGRRVRASGCSVSSQFPPLHENASIVSSTEGSGSRLTYHEIEPFPNSSNNGRAQEARRVPNKYRSDLPRYKPPSQRSNESLHDSVLKRQRSTSSQCAGNEEPPDNSGEDMSSFLDCRTGSKTLSSTDRLFVSASSFASLSTPAEGAASALCSKNAAAVVPHKNSLISSALVCHTDSSDARCCPAEPEPKTSSHLLLRKGSQALSVLNHSTLVSKRTGQFGGTETKQSSYRGSLDTVLSATSESSSQRRLLSQRRSLQVSSLLARRTSEINCPKIHHRENDEKKGNGDGKQPLAEGSQSRVCHCGGASRDKAKSKKREQKLALQDLQSQTELMKKDNFDDDSDVGGAGAASSSNRAPHAAPSSHTNSAANASQKGPSEPKNTPNNTTRQSQNNTIGDLSECCGVLEQRDSTSSGSALSSSSSLPTVQRQILTAVPPSGAQRHRNKHASFVKVAVRQRQPNRAQVVS